MIESNFDIIIFDHPSYESLLSTAALMASDTILIPATDYDVQTGALTEFLETIAATLADVETRENATAQALGQKTQTFGWDGVHVIPSIVSPRIDEAPTTMIPPPLLPITIRKESGYIDALARQPIFETPFFLLDQRRIGRDAYVAGRFILDELYRAVERISRASAKWSDGLT